MALNTPNDLFHYGLSAIYDGEKKIAQMLEALTMAVIGAAMKVEHYEIATYRGLVDKACSPLPDPGSVALAASPK